VFTIEGAANRVAEPALCRVGVEAGVPEQSHVDFRQGRGDGKPVQAQGVAVLFGEALRDEADVVA
jgi:hypothetical protein